MLKGCSKNKGKCQYLLQTYKCCKWNIRVFCVQNRSTTVVLVNVKTSKHKL